MPGGAADAAETSKGLWQHGSMAAASHHHRTAPREPSSTPVHWYDSAYQFNPYKTTSLNHTPPTAKFSTPKSLVPLAPLASTCRHVHCSCPRCWYSYHGDVLPSSRASAFSRSLHSVRFSARLSLTSQHLNASVPQFFNCNYKTMYIRLIVVCNIGPRQLVLEHQLILVSSCTPEPRTLEVRS